MCSKCLLNVQHQRSKRIKHQPPRHFEVPKLLNDFGEKARSKNQLGKRHVRKGWRKMPTS
eukprot:6175109-Pleurochrysis_carterae.AAC.1